MTVNSLRGLHGDELVSYVGCDLFRIALARVAETATTRQLQSQTLAGRDRLLPLPTQRPT